MRKIEILDYFDPRLFHTDLKATAKREVLKELVSVVSAGSGVRDPNLLLEMLEQREELGSTGIGKGVAIPHGRSLAVIELKVLFALSKKGADFDSIDGKPVRIFFLIVAPPQDKRNDYLPLLGKIAGLVQEKKARDRIAKVADFEELKAILREAGGE